MEPFNEMAPLLRVANEVMQLSPERQLKAKREAVELLRQWKSGQRSAEGCHPADWQREMEERHSRVEELLAELSQMAMYRHLATNIL